MAVGLEQLEIEVRDRGELAGDRSGCQFDIDGLGQDTRERIIVTMGLINKVQENRINADLEKLGLTAMQAQIMLYILRRQGDGGEITARDLEKFFRVSNPTMSGILKRMEKKELIERCMDSADKRNKLIHLRGNADDLYRLASRHINAEKEKVFQNFTPEELENLLQLLTKLLSNIIQDGDWE